MPAVDYAIGLMSGTSLDSVDGALVAITHDDTMPIGAAGSVSVDVVGWASEPIPTDLKQALLAMQANQSVRFADFAIYQYQWTTLAAKVCQPLQQQSTNPVSAIGCHGQTVYHQPQTVSQSGFSWQWGNAAQLAAATGSAVVSDFRNGDMAAGGQGAPLVPYVQALLFGHLEHPPLFLNLGGIANLTVLPSSPPLDQPIWQWQGVQGFDTGPGNMLLDAAANCLFNKPYDDGGALAASGMVNATMLAHCQQHPYYAQPLPKSTGREQFGEAYLAELLNHFSDVSPNDVMATLTELTAWSVVEGLKQTIPPNTGPQRVWVSGGGVYNAVLLSRLNHHCQPLGITCVALDKVSPIGNTQMEALAFAVLAWVRMQGWPGNVAAATGASTAVPLGSVTLLPLN